MQRYGQTAAGTPRWYCSVCRLSRIRTRPDRTASARRRDFVAWLTGVRDLSDLAQDTGVSRQTLTAWLAPFWDEPLPVPLVVDVTGQVLIVDGLELQHGASVLVGRTPARVASWAFTAGESTADWTAFAVTVTGVPWAVVLDGRAGLLATVQQRWPDAHIQRCLFHIRKRLRTLLTRSPKLLAGQILRRLSRTLMAVRTRRQKRRWLRQYRHWERRFARFLDERTTTNHWTPTGRQRSWFTHKQLRAARSLIRNALPHLFTYVRHPAIPRTTNHVEGGLNARLEELLGRHRGLTLHRKQRLAALFLASRQ